MRSLRDRALARRLGGIVGGLLGIVVMMGAGMSPASAAPDPTLFPTVIDVPTVTATYTGPASSNSVGGSFMALPIGAVPAGTAKVLHGHVVNASSADQCIFVSGHASGYFEMAPRSANLTLLESEGLVIPAGALPAPGDAILTNSYPLSSSTSDWECDYGVLLAPGESFDYSVTVGVPLGGTPITNASTVLRVRLEAAQRPPQTWNDADYLSGSVLPGAPVVINASDPTTNWGITGLTAGTPAAGQVQLYPGKAIGAYGVLTNDLPYPVTVSFAGFTGAGTMAPFLVSDLQDWADPVTLEPGETTGPFFMAIGMPSFIGNESRETAVTFDFAWDVSAPPASAYTVTFDANGGSGSMAPQTADAPAALSPNGFSRSGYAFAGWNTAADGSGVAYADGAVFPFDADATLYAQWTAAEIVTPPPPPPPSPSPSPAPPSVAPPSPGPGGSGPGGDTGGMLAATGAGNVLPWIGGAAIALLAGAGLVAAGVPRRRRA